MRSAAPRSAAAIVSSGAAVRVLQRSWRPIVLRLAEDAMFVGGDLDGGAASWLCRPGDGGASSSSLVCAGNIPGTASGGCVRRAPPDAILRIAYMRRLGRRAVAIETVVRRPYRVGRSPRCHQATLAYSDSNESTPAPPSRSSSSKSVSSGRRFPSASMI